MVFYMGIGTLYRVVKVFDTVAQYVAARLLGSLRARIQLHCCRIPLEH